MIGCSNKVGDEKCALRNATHCEHDLFEGPHGSSDNFLCYSTVLLATNIGVIPHLIILESHQYIWYLRRCLYREVGVVARKK